MSAAPPSPSRTTRRSWPDLLGLSRPALGTWSQIASEECIDMLGAAGLDYTIIDCEHGAFGIETAERMIRACDANGLAPLVRILEAQPKLVGQALDAGAAAVVVPGVSSAAQARDLVAAARFAPEGTRGACPCVRAGGHFIRDWRGYAGLQREHVGVIALVETAAGLAEIEEICAVEGLLALLVGPFDLSVSLGFAGDYLHPDVQAALDRMLAAARASSLPVIAPIFNPDAAEAARQRDEWRAKGASMFVIGTDKIIFADAVSRYAVALRGA
jgi:4-hydroxy-2-oxoheptanedioate aldolase